ncbi:MAG: nicotinate-nucleotide adenylyltransferase [Gloeobacteraceae cyanobacterium ES-bin-316]|nr:nicotinate-nucleotide adenylyltransferase [Ferruginibacter sp.]
MIIGLYFGSFNPIHNGHLIIASHILNKELVDELWFVVSPQNPFKNSSSLLNQNHRLNLVKNAIEGEDKMKVSNIEFKLPKPSYTSITLAYLKEKYPLQEFTIIMGSDGFQNLPKWQNAKSIIEEYPIIIYKRPGFEITETHDAKVTVLDAPLLEISSTHIRKLIKEKKSIRFLVPETVREEIAINQYYQSASENPS